MNVAIYGAGEIGKRVLNKIEPFLNDRNKMIYFVETKKTKEKWQGYIVKDLGEINLKDFDILIAAVPNLSEIRNVSLANHPDRDLIMKKIRFVSQIDVLFNNSFEEFVPYSSVKLDSDLKFVASSVDYSIAESMYMFNKCFAEDQIKIFFDLMKKYCDFDINSKGIFLDIGANIGTTSIYAKKKLAPNMRYIGFEAGYENYKLFKCNCIINDVEDILVENIALGEETCKGSFQYDSYNSGSGCVRYNDDFKDTLEVQSLDGYMCQCIDKEEVKCIWLDTEGCEAEILLGAKNLLNSRRIPMMQEFNPGTYEKRGKDKEYYELMNHTYTNFIDVEDLSKLYDIKFLSEYRKIMENNGKKSGDLFFF